MSPPSSERQKAPRRHSGPDADDPVPFTASAIACDASSALVHLGRKGRAGAPAQIIPAGRSRVTTEPAPTTHPSPIVTLPTTIVPNPIRQFDPMRTVAASALPDQNTLLVGSSYGWSSPTSATRFEIKTWEPMLTLVPAWNSLPIDTSSPTSKKSGDMTRTPPPRSTFRPSRAFPRSWSRSVWRRRACRNARAAAKTGGNARFGGALVERSSSFDVLFEGLICSRHLHEGRA